MAQAPADEVQRVALLHSLDILNARPEPAFDTITQLAAKLLRVPIALVTLIDAQRQWFKSTVGIELSVASRETSFCAHALLESRALVVPDARLDSRFFDNPQVTGAPHVRAYAGVPLLSIDGRALGTLCVLDRQPREFSAAELELLVDLASIAARELQHREAALRARADADGCARVLEDSEAHFRAVFDQAAIGITIVGLDGRLLQFNQKLCDILHRSADELSRLTFMDFTHPDDLAMDLAQIERLMRGEASTYLLEKRYLRPDGSVVWGSLTVSLVRQDGLPQHLISVVEDITARKQAEALMEQRVQEATERLQDLYDNAPCGYYSLDADRKFLHINKTALDWIGYSLEELVGLKGPADFLSGESREIFLRGFPVLMSGGHIGPVEFDLHGRGQARRRISLSASTVQDEQGQFVMTRTVIYDITELDRVRSAMESLSREQAVMLDNDLIGIVKLRERRALWHNQALEHMFGYEPGELNDWAMRELYADQGCYERIGKEAYPVLANGGTYRTQLPMRRKSGKTIWVDLSGATLDAEADTSMWMMLDITLMKERQQQAEHLAYHDALTGLPNRLLLRDRALQALALAGRTRKMLALCYVDLDGFKAVNDRLGHDAGDALLIEISKRLSDGVRGHDTVARVGGDEFVLLLTQFTTQHEVAPILQRLLASVARPVPLGAEREGQVSASIGIAFFPADGDDLEQLMAVADEQMYRAKAAGKNQYQGLADTEA